MNLPKIPVFSFLLLFLIAGCDKKQPATQSTPVEHNKDSVLFPAQKSPNTDTNAELEAFKRANTLFNLREYDSAESAYHDFIFNYTLSSRAKIAQQRLQDIQNRRNAVYAFQAEQQAQSRAAAAAAAEKAQAQASETARIMAANRNQSQTPAQNNSGFSTTGTAKGTGKSKGDAYAAARQKLPAGAVEISTVYDWPGNQSYFICKITYRTK